ncbi:MAG: helix-turn-helix domain-containing protein [Labilithrix sp.]|nr:helix-turn-helix domain-containing protein [Labilithrix sp.]MBX3221531.1 helix-turn-helix domain-containing protein [Labilithrix sp.]
MALLRPSELARLWELHPKTVNLWIREGKLKAFRTPGAQYRVRSDDARAYCEKNNLPPLPRAVTSPGGTVAAIGKPGAALRALAKACKARGTSFVAFASVLEGLLGVAADAPDVLAIDARCDEVKLADIVRALRRTEKMASVAVVVYDADATKSSALAKLGVTSVVTRGKSEEAAQAVVDLLDGSGARPAARRA